MELTKAEIKELKQKNKEHFNKAMKQLFDMIPKEKVVKKKWKPRRKN